MVMIDKFSTERVPRCNGSCNATSEDCILCEIPGVHLRADWPSSSSTRHRPRLFWRWASSWSQPAGPVSEFLLSELFHAVFSSLSSPSLQLCLQTLHRLQLLHLTWRNFKSSVRRKNLAQFSGTVKPKHYAKNSILYWLLITSLINES